MASTITLTSSIRSNLSSLRNISSQMSKTQERLSSGKKVNSAIDNASSYYQARSLTSRAGDLDALLDTMGQGIQTIRAANEGLEAATLFLEQMKSVANQASEIIETTDQTVSQAPTAETSSVENANAEKTSLTFHELFDGRSNTEAIVKQLGKEALPAYAATQFYAPGITSDDENFGTGKWYLPAIGELMEMYGVAYNEISGCYLTGNNFTIINNALKTLASKDSTLADYITYYNTWWSSSEYDDYHAWFLHPQINLGSYRNDKKDLNCDVRFFQLLENKFNFSNEEANEGSSECIAVGDIVYADLSYGKADDYDGSKVAVGVVSNVYNNGTAVKIMNLKDIHFSSNKTTDNFNPDEPYTGDNKYTQWTTGSYYNTNSTVWKNVIDVTDYSALDVKTIGQNIASGNLSIFTITSETSDSDTSTNINSYQTQFNNLLNEYDDIISNSTYQGIDLLNGGSLNITFNENYNNTYTVKGFDATSTGLGILFADWTSDKDISVSIEELDKAIKTLRSYAETLGNSYSIIETRQNFTESLIDVLETGSDNLVLADMNEESANYLALQTRQQLATNALSLASQSAQSVLKLF